MLTKTFSKLLIESSKAFQDLQDLLAGDKEAVKFKKSKDPVEYLDYVYLKYESDIEAIMKKYKLDYDELGSMLMKL